LISGEATSGAECASLVADRAADRPHDPAARPPSPLHRLEEAAKAVVAPAPIIAAAGEISSGPSRRRRPLVECV